MPGLVVRMVLDIALTLLRPLSILVLGCLSVGWSLVVAAQGDDRQSGELTNLGTAWAGNTVNAVIFRQQAITSDSIYQFTSYYDTAGFVVVGKRLLSDNLWEWVRTSFRGNVRDAHNMISIAIDGKGYVHLAWDHHGSPLQYVRSTSPYGLLFTDPMMMTGKHEVSVSYPAFYNLPGGDLLFMYRDGASGSGNLVINRYDVSLSQWIQVQANLVSGENKRNAYWQAAIDPSGTLHLSWVWRESPDVASNHDLCYARSRDGGLHWETADGVALSLPITQANAEMIWRIPMNRSLINQTSMTADANGFVAIATYWAQAGDSIPQFSVLARDSAGWQLHRSSFRNVPFSLSGGGTKRIPVSRPQIISWINHGERSIALIFRDASFGDQVTVAQEILGPTTKGWTVTRLLDEKVGMWEPMFDQRLWQRAGVVDLLVQHVEQIDAEGVAGVEGTMVKLFRWWPQISK